MMVGDDERIVIAAPCRDADAITKVPDAGTVRREGDTRVQVMHNGLKVVADGYCGAWMTRLIQTCQGHHEPQEERLFHAVLPHLFAAILLRDMQAEEIRMFADQLEAGATLADILRVIFSSAEFRSKRVEFDRLYGAA